MKTYARIEGHLVAELFATAAPIGTLFHPSLTWVDVTGVAGVASGWSWDGKAAHPPVAAAPMPALTLADVQAELTRLSAAVASMSGHG